VLRHDRIEKISKDFVTFLISRNDANGFDHRMPTVVHAHLDAAREAHAELGLLTFQPPVEVWLLLEHICQGTVVSRQIRQHLRTRLCREAGEVLCPKP
jgi:hypothetical protein